MIVAGVLSAVGASASADVGQAAAPPDWLMITVSAGAAGAVVDADVYGWVHQGNATRLAEGIGVGGSTPSIQVREVKTGLGADLGVASNGGLGRIALDPIVQHDHSYRLSARRRFTIAPNEHATLLAFVAGGSFSSYGSYASVISGSATSAQSQGSGSALILAGAPEDSGTGVVVGSGGGGVTRKDVDATTGLVGAINTRACRACTGQWVAGDEVSGAFTVSPVGLDGAPTFAGPAGFWTWDWSGVSEAAVVAAYAPIGDAWRSFRA